MRQYTVTIFWEENKRNHEHVEELRLLRNLLEKELES
jgi:hypothetical protein